MTGNIEPEMLALGSPLNRLNPDDAVYFKPDRSLLQRTRHDMSSIATREYG
jgi:hypothetical protein